MSRPRLLDLFCGAGGAAMGYHQAGFDVIGVDINPQPRYPFEFHQADALTFPLDGGGVEVLVDGDVLEVPLDGFDAIHASPPCQKFTRMQRAVGNADAHLDLIPETRARLQAAAIPWVMENVTGAPLLDAFTLCGASFGLEVVRHRLFEASLFLLAPPCGHIAGGTTTGQYVAFRQGGRVAPGRVRPPRCSAGEWRAAIQCPWMTQKEARDAIPPAYTRFIGEQLLTHLGVAA